MGRSNGATPNGFKQMIATSLLIQKVKSTFHTTLLKYWDLDVD